jgi:hypothetical protein
MKTNKKYSIENQSSEYELSAKNELLNLFRSCPIPNDELLSSLSLFLNRQYLSRILFLSEMYKKQLDVQGVTMEFGVRWGSNISIMKMLHGIYEPYNVYRKIIGFDTFTGFPSVDKKDGSNEMIKVGGHGVTGDYEFFLNSVLDYHEKNAPISHIKKYELIRGDASKTLKKYLEQNPETIISFAYFDFDIYQPTRDCLQLVMERVTKGSIIAFDELNYPKFPGETLALMEVLGLSRYAIKRSPHSDCVSYFVVD